MRSRGTSLDHGALRPNVYKCYVSVITPTRVDFLGDEQYPLQCVSHWMIPQIARGIPNSQRHSIHGISVFFEIWEASFLMDHL